MTAAPAKKTGRFGGRTFTQALARDFKQHKWKYVLITPVLIYLAIFMYRPMQGLVIAFKDFRPALGIWGSRWSDPWYRHFQAWFTDPFFFRVVRNTFSLSFLNLLIGFPPPIILALLLNELRNQKFKRVVQTITYMPFFISIVVVASLVRTYFSFNGMFSQLAVFFGGQPRNFLMESRFFYPIFIGSEVWQFVGWNSIIFLAVIASIDQEQYEAARIDGANRFQQMFKITFPNLIPIISLLLILRMGSILNVSFERVLLLYNPAIYDVSDIISTYVFRRGLLDGNFSFATAVGIFNSFVNLFFLLTANYISKKRSGNSLF
ncbi:MAG: ABC transporter permease subunit [Defluviitaleaceae bacterium]|nr:ABC transporter permease subunit [Defluviitaleaceae bacterium]